MSQYSIPDRVDGILTLYSYEEIVEKKKTLKKQLAEVLIKYNKAQRQEKRKLFYVLKDLKQEFAIWGEAEFIAQKLAKSKK